MPAIPRNEVSFGFSRRIMRRNCVLSILPVTLIGALGAMGLSSCGGDDSSGPSPKYTVGGTVAGLPSGTSVVLQNDAKDNLTVSANGKFTFATSLAGGAAFSVSVLTQPSGATCTATGNVGTVASVNVTSVAVTCAVDAYTVGGAITGLPTGSSVVLQNDAGDNLTVSANGNFTFAKSLDTAAKYSVTVLTQPVGAVCTVSNGTGAIAAANITNVAVACAVSYTVGGTITGLPTGSSAVLQDNGADNLTVSANGTFKFATGIAAAAKYSVTVLTQPGSEVCSVTNGSGAIAKANVTNVTVVCGSTATAGSTAFSALSIGNARIAMVPLNLYRSTSANNGVAPVLIQGTTALKGAFVATTFPIESCSTDSSNLVAICINYNASTVAILDLTKFATTFNIADIVDHEFDTGAPATTTPFSGADCILCGVVAVSNLKSFVVSAYDGYRVYAYPVATAVSPLTPTKIYAVPITENFTLSSAHNWLISGDYNQTLTSNRVLRVIDLLGQKAYTWSNYTDACGPSPIIACSNFAAAEVDSDTFSDDTGLLTLVNEDGDAQLTVDLSQAAFSAASSTFTAPYVYSDFSLVDTLQLGDMSGVLASSTGHWGFTVAEFADATVGVQQLAAAPGTGGSLTLPAPNPIYLNMTNLTNFAPCTSAPVGGTDPHAQGYTLSAAGVPLGLFVSGDSTCVAVINLALLYAAPRQASPNANLIDLTSYDPVKAGAVTFYSVAAATAAAPAKLRRVQHRQGR